LWEDQSRNELDSYWTALLPLLTDRFYVGGLDPSAVIEHAYAGLLDQKLAGRPLDNWTDTELDQFCRRYNIGWFVCRSRSAIARLRAWHGAELCGSTVATGKNCLFRLRLHSFAIKGQARLVCADFRRITVTDVIPEDGVVILSLHYQTGMRVSPSRVQIEKEPDPNDPIPFIRLRVPNGVACLTLTWQNR
jgi:hypothetical protein